MKHRKIIGAALVAVTICSCIAFIAGLGLGYGSAGFEALEAPQAVNNPAADHYQPAERPAPPGELLLEDNFSQKLWPEYQDADHNKGYADEQYFILVEAEEYTFWSLAEETFADFILEIETQQLDGPDDNDYGVILRHQDDANFYTFKISGDGFYSFGKLVDNEFYDIIPWQDHPAIRQGNSRNRLRVEAVSENFSFYVNDELIDAAVDPDFQGGDIGLLAGTYQTPGVQISFDNLKVWAIEK